MLNSPLTFGLKFEIEQICFPHSHLILVSSVFFSHSLLTIWSYKLCSVLLHTFPVISIEFMCCPVVGTKGMTGISPGCMQFKTRKVVCMCKYVHHNYYYLFT